MSTVGPLTGQLCALAFLARIIGPSSPAVGRVTGAYLLLCTLAAVVSVTGGTARAQMLGESTTGAALLWRLLGALAYTDELGARFAPLAFFVVSLWARAEPKRRVQLGGAVSVGAAAAPWCLLALSVAVAGSRASLPNLIALGAALALDAALAACPPPPPASLRSLEGGKRTLRWGQPALAQQAAAAAALGAVAGGAADGAEGGSLTADALTIFALWSFGADHWAQSLQQRQPGAVSLLHGGGDDEPLRQALARSDVGSLAGGEAAQVAEVFELLGLSRLLVTPEAQARVGAAIDAHRQQRARYDLPMSMSDSLVLSELLTLIELPRSSEELLAAVAAHRSQRAIASASSLALVAQKLRAALYNDSTALDADGAPLLAPSETWSVAAINGTVHALVGEALNLLELEPEQAEPEQWRSLLGRLNLSHSDAEQLTPRLADGPLPSSVPPAEAGRPASAGGAGGGGAGDTLLRLAFREQRERRARERAAEWLASRAFEELIATVRAEDPSLADEDRRRAEQRRVYEGRRLGLLTTLLRRSAELGLAGSRADEAAELGGALLSEPGVADGEEHYGRLLKLPQLVSTVLANYVGEASGELSDKQAFRELLRLMGLADALEPRLMRTIVEAVKQHRLRREGGRERGEPEPLTHRPALASARPLLPAADHLVNAGGDGNKFAIFIACLMQLLGAQVAPLEAALLRGETEEVRPVCQLLAEVRLGKRPSRLSAWVRAALPRSRWLGRTYHYRVDADGFVWLNLDWLDAQQGVQRPGVPYKAFERQTVYYPAEGRWEEEEGEAEGRPRAKHWSVHSIKMSSL
ncbi:hypothetical protein EMIHUDRAFT_453175 [Emiliania huxleyi CCMP1516]|uniref:Uncharacterized protein n=2 Tax=Emiliania huxleyi TaxID=2903 RepID=A0A0D3IA67_EMIH1|nr:hypothetical protein EMIHUDRAFT_453175 [Emiliania huxleyi CCMP1516]EOD08152.1 hypothetical protein EMIHUDRAFT_453175 [Emiliania huxleyi CCMP1516]|eukprot:XP_005760581.1 hypothetical protein EMIHUDRAFT_453175 [Emiliania huxleyi CCMP1516]